MYLREDTKFQFQFQSQFPNPKPYSTKSIPNVLFSQDQRPHQTITSIVCVFPPQMKSNDWSKIWCICKKRKTAHDANHVHHSTTFTTAPQHHREPENLQYQTNPAVRIAPSTVPHISSRMPMDIERSAITFHSNDLLPHEPAPQGTNIADLLRDRPL
jgi:hypothetical protein